MLRRQLVPIPKFPLFLALTIPQAQHCKYLRSFFPAGNFLFALEFLGGRKIVARLRKLPDTASENACAIIARRLST